MITNNDQNKQLPNELTSTFKELHVLKHLRKAGITKSFGFSCAYLFQVIFCLIFENKNWFRMLTLGWSDGATFIPVDFSLLSSKTSQVNGISTKVDKRSSGYKRAMKLYNLHQNKFLI
jgi:hypothetical protein